MRGMSQIGKDIQHGLNSDDHASHTPCSKAAESSLAYQHQVIENLVRSERAMKRRYHDLHNAIEFAQPRDVFSATINTSVHIATDRGIDDFSPQYPEPPPTVKPRTLVGELLLCFQLLNDLLGYHLAITNYSDISSHGYDNLRSALEKIQAAEQKRLEEEYSDAHIYVKAEAAKNVKTRLRELAKAGYLKKRIIEQDVLKVTATEGNVPATKPEKLPLGNVPVDQEQAVPVSGSNASGSHGYLPNGVV
jgi:hypothetical protein